MMKIERIEKVDNLTLDEITSVHIESFKGFFLTFLGKGFLKQMYASYCEHNQSGLIGAFDAEGKIVGFLAYSENLSGLYKFMINKKLK